MFANDKSIDNLESLFKEVRKYIELQGQYVKLDLVEKLTILLSTLILILIIIILSMMALFYFSFMLVYALAPLVGSLIGGYAIIGGVVLGHTHLPNEKTMDIPAYGTFPRTLIP